MSLGIAHRPAVRLDRPTNARVLWFFTAIDRSFRQLINPAMPRQRTERSAMTIGQLAKHWGVGRDRVDGLIADGQLLGVFAIPSTGRYGETVKIPLASVVEAEARWVVDDNGKTEKRKRPPRRNNGSKPNLKNFPELNRPPEQDADDDANDPRPDEHSDE